MAFLVTPALVSKPRWISFAYFLTCVILRYTSGMIPADGRGQNDEPF